MTHELDNDGRSLFLQLSADLYEQAMTQLDGDPLRNEGLVFWQAIREAMDAEAEQHRRRMAVYRMLEDVAVTRMAKVQGMPYDRIGARAGKRSRSWAFQHTMPPDLVRDVLDLYARAEQEERDAFINAAQDDAESVTSGKVVGVIPINVHAKRPAPEAARRSILYRQLRRFLGGAAALAGPAYLAAKAATESYTATVQTALMSNGALTPLPGLDPLSSSGLSGVLSASAAPGVTAQAAGPVSTVVGKMVAGAVITVQATAGVSAPAAVAAVAAAGTPVVMAVEDAAKPIAAALGFEQPDPAPIPEILAALPETPTSPGEEAHPYPEWQVPTVYGTETPTSAPTPEPSMPPDHTASRMPAAAPVTTSTTPVSPSPSNVARSSPPATAAPTPMQTVAPAPAPSASASAGVTSVPSPASTSAAPTTAPTAAPPAPTPTTTMGTGTPTPSTGPSSPPATSTPETTPADEPNPAPSSSQPTPTQSEPQPEPTPTSPPPAPTPVPTPFPTSTPAGGEPAPEQTAGPEPTSGGESGGAPAGSAPQEGPVGQPLAFLPAGAGGMLPRPAAAWWYGPAGR